MKKYEIAFFLLIAVTRLFSQDSNTYVVGNVTDANQQALHDVHVIIKETDRGTYTDASGKYTILAKPGDILLFSYIGMQAVEIRVENSPSVINIGMQAISIELESLEIKARRKYKTPQDLLAEYPTNKKLIKTSWGIIDKETSSIRMRIIDGKHLISVGTDFLYSLQGHYPQMHVDRIDGRVYFQKISYSSDPPVIFDVDGVIYISIPTHLAANDIDRVAILERNAAMIKYGPQGAGGVIVVNTKGQTWMDDAGPGTNRLYDNRSLVDSLTREVTRLEAYRPYEPAPIGKIHKAKTEKQALALFAEKKKKYRNNPYYLLEAYDYFSSHWGDNEQSNELFQHIIEGYKNDVVVLKALAYLQQQHGHYKSALSLYLKILAGQYGNAQSHRDVANAYAEVGDFEKAMVIYTGYANDVCQLPHPLFDPTGEDRLITTEMLNILERNKAVLGDNHAIKSTTTKSDTLIRLVFEWNNPAAEFEVQLVAPDGDYDTWANKTGKDASPNSEAVQGYSSKAFFLPKENKGSWQVNMDYKGNQSEMPTYLKVSVYHDYGLTNQHTEIKVYKLSENHEKVQLLVLQQD